MNLQEAKKKLSEYSESDHSPHKEISTIALQMLEIMAQNSQVTYSLQEMMVILGQKQEKIQVVRQAFWRGLCDNGIAVVTPHPQRLQLLIELAAAGG